MNFYKKLIPLGKTIKPFDIYINKFSPCLSYSPKCVSLNMQRSYKMFVQIENKYAYEMLESKGHMKKHYLEKMPASVTGDFDVFIKQDWEKKTPQELCESFGTIAKYCSDNNICISNTIFDNFIDAFTDSIKHFTDEELKQTFLHFTMLRETPSVKTRNFIEIWAALDDACLARFRNWTADEKLMFANFTFELGIAKICDYTKKAIQRLTTNAKNLTVSQLLQTSFLINATRNTPFDKHNLELYLEKNIDKFTLDDMSIMAMGFFKSKSPIRSPQLVKIIIQKLIDGKDELDDIPLAALLKLVRYSYRITSETDIRNLFTELEGQIPRMSLTACVHFALIGSSALILHESSLSRIIERVASDITNTRLKDLERLVLTLATLNYEPKNVDFVNLVFKELRKPERKDEIVKYGRCLNTCMQFATVLGYYPYDLISQCLDPEFIKESYGEALALLGRELLVLHNTVEIHCPDYSGNKLPNKTVKFLAKTFTDYVPDENYHKQYNVAERMFLDIMRMLESILGERKYFCGDFALPHYQRGDIFFCLDKQGNPLDISEHFPIKPFGQIKWAPTQDDWVAIIVCARNAMRRGTSHPTGPFVAKYRDLRKIGYRPVFVNYFDWVKLNENEEKIEFLKNLIKQDVKT